MFIGGVASGMVKDHKGTLSLSIMNYNLIFRLIKLVKDSMKYVRSESALQRTLLAVDMMREAHGSYKASNSTNSKLKEAIRAILNLN